MNNVDYIDRDSYTLRFIDMGDESKPPIFVIGSSIYYSRLFENPIYSDLHLVILDHRGFVIPENNKDKYNLEVIIGDIEAIREYLGYDQIFLLGHSGHGFMAMEYARLYTERVLGLILSNLAPTNSQSRQDKSIKFFEENASKERKEIFERDFKKYKFNIDSTPNERFNFLNLQMQSHSFYKFNFDSSPLWKNVENNMNALDFLWGFEFAEYDTLDTLDYLKDSIPILLVLGQHDYLVGPISLWDKILDITKIPLYTLENSGHNPMLEESEFYHAILYEFTC